MGPIRLVRCEDAMTISRESSGAGRKPALTSANVNQWVKSVLADPAWARPVNSTADLVRYLLMLTPGSMVGDFEELVALIDSTPSEPPDPQQWMEIATKYDTEFLDMPPLAS